MMERYYNAHLYPANWGTHQVMLRLPRALLSLESLGALTAPQRALADFLRLDTGLLTIAAEASAPLAETKGDPRKLAKWIKDLPAGDKDTLLCRVTQGQGAQVQMELRRRFHGGPGSTSGSRPRRTVAELLDAAAEARH
jgi:hypothetical protein